MNRNSVAIPLAVVVAWLLGLMALGAGVATLWRSGHLTLVPRMSAAWLVCVGLSLMLGAWMLLIRRTWGARLLIVACGLWLTIQAVGTVRHFFAASHWSTGSWVIIGIEMVACTTILAAVLSSVRRAAGATGQSTQPNAA